MPNPVSDVYPRAALLGFAAGLRSQLPLALLARAIGNRAFTQNVKGPFALLRNRTVQCGLALAATGEFIADKTPFVPSRINPGPLAGRLVAGGLTASAFARYSGRSILPAALLGATTAGLGSFAGYYARTGLTKKTGLPDLPVALAEDGLAYLLSRLSLRR